MKRRTALFTRALVLLVGCALLGLGGYAIAWVLQFPLAREWVARIDRPRVIDVPDQRWWPWALAATVALGLLIGITLLAVTLTRRRTSPVQLYDSVTGTAVTVELGPAASGIAGELAALPGVRHTKGRAVVERGLPTLSVVVTADPALVDIADFTAQAEGIAARVAHDLGYAPVATQVLLHLDRADHRAEDSEPVPVT